MAVRQDAPVSDAAISVIGSGTKIIGDVESTGIVKVDGVIEGAIRGAKQLLLGRTGTINGDIYAEEVVLGGKVIGTIIATRRAEIQGTCSVHGNIQTKSIIVLEGGVINGTVQMDGSTAHLTPTAARSGLALSQ